jgi:histidinol phosphatase-like PHP family hydrolase
MARYVRFQREAETAAEVRELIRLTEEQMEAVKLTSRSEEDLELRLAALAKDMDYLRDRLATFGGDND